jgi:hypothetical protein
MRIPYISLLAAGSLALGGCAYGDLGLGVGYGGGYGDYGYGYGSPYYGYGYGSPYYGAGYGSYGWYDNYYYPGTGYYVYDSYRRPHVWNDRQRTYWISHGHAIRTSGNVTTVRTTPNWSGFRTRNVTNTTSSTSDQSDDRTPDRHHRRH